MSSRFARALLAPAAVAAAIALAGCNGDTLSPTGRALAPLSDQMIALLKEKHMDKTSPILLRIYKEELQLEVWKVNQDGQYALLKTYPICRWSGQLGPKKKEGDRQAPEGFYTITQGADESELELLSLVQHRLSRTPSTAPGAAPAPS